MPTYDFACDACRVMYQVHLGMNDPRPQSCPTCDGDLRRVLSPPLLNTQNFTSPTAAKYAKLSASEETAREKQLQQVYERIWLPPEVIHSPWEEEDH